MLYHALASADIHPTANGQPVATAYPTLAELDVIENYIYSRAQRRLESFTNPVIAVFIGDTACEKYLPTRMIVGGLIRRVTT